MLSGLVLVASFSNDRHAVEIVAVIAFLAIAVLDERAVRGLCAGLLKDATNALKLAVFAEEFLV